MSLGKTRVAGVLWAMGCVAAGGCFTVDDASVRAMAPVGPAINAHLHRDYLALASTQDAQGDWRSRSLFAYKARAAARGETVIPEQLEDWRVPRGQAATVRFARARLATALVTARGERAPAVAARAQVMFDCWVEALEQDDTTPLSECRDAFRSALADFEKALSSQ